MTILTNDNGESQPSSRDLPKARRCLRCEDIFQSDWSGERICRRCKSTAAWRQGIPPQASSAGRKG